MSCFKCLTDKVACCPRTCGSEWTDRGRVAVVSNDSEVDGPVRHGYRLAYQQNCFGTCETCVCTPCGSVDTIHQKASTNKSGIRLQLASSSQLRSRPAMLASRCQTLRARIPRTRSEPTGCAAPSARREGLTAATACYRHRRIQTASDS